MRACNVHQKKSAQCQGAQPIQEEWHHHSTRMLFARSDCGLLASRSPFPRLNPLMRISPGPLPAVRGHGQTACSAGANRTYRLIIRPRLHWLHNGIRQALPRPAQPYRRPEPNTGSTFIVNAQSEPLDNQTGPVVSTTINTQQREWVGRFNAVASAVQLLDELLDEFTNAVRQQAQVSFTQRPAQRQRRPRTPPNQMADVATK
ncbi:hypothetical protein niasHT_008659 [Heterodera trifolii]|uniref:Uncharacterized protein n=1 Tax=Heterodera trifolii TaxID=157864 RepID=A0ABD2LX51_9BILA